MSALCQKRKYAVQHCCDAIIAQHVQSRPSHAQPWKSGQARSSRLPPDLVAKIAISGKLRPLSGPTDGFSTAGAIATEKAHHRRGWLLRARSEEPHGSATK
jgi:hypothetical protein